MRRSVKLHNIGLHNISFLKEPERIPYAKMIDPAGHFFPHSDGTGVRPVIRQLISQKTHHNRFPWHNVFFRKMRHKIESFADVGCAMLRKAPLTVEAREILPPETEVYAVDLFISGEGRPPSFRDGKEIKVWVQSIVDAPLPKQVDVIRFTRVSLHLNRTEFKRAMANIFRSLKPGGYLMQEKYIFKKVDGGFEMVAKGTQ